MEYFRARPPRCGASSKPIEWPPAAPLRADEELGLIFAWRELRKVTKDLTLHYERKLYLLADTPENRRLIGKYIEVFQFPDGRIEIRVAGQSLSYSIYDKLGAIDQGAIVENKRLGHMLQVVQLVQAKRDSRSVDRPSTAHRADGTRIPRTRVVDSKTQRELGPEDLQKALDAITGALAATLDPGASAALRASDCAAVGRPPTKAKTRRVMATQADTST